MTKRSIQGKPVLPMMIKKVPKSMGTYADWNEMNESGVNVNPTSLNNVALEKKPLKFVISYDHEQ